jgi:RimJ/RimL family protein N-acetyltransferase
VPRVTETARLRLEPLGPEHLEELLALRSEPLVSEWFGGFLDTAAAEERLASSVAEWEEGLGSWSAYRLEDGDYVGQGGPRWFDVEGRRVVEVGWSLMPRHWGRGYATEIGAAGIDLAFDVTDVEEVVAYTLPENSRSRAVMERLGLSYERDIEHAGKRHVLYRLGRKRWAESRARRS